MARLTEAAPVAGMELAIALVRLQCGRLQHMLRPVIQVIAENGIHGDVCFPGLIDGHLHRVDVVQWIENFQCSQCVDTHLGVSDCRNLHSNPVLKIDHIQDTVCNDDAVCCAEATFDKAFILDFLLHQHHHIRCPLPCFLHQFHDIIPVAVRALLHFRIIISKVLHRAVHLLPQSLLQFILAHLMGVGALLRKAGRYIRHIGTELCTRRTVDPAFRAGWSFFRMRTHRFSASSIKTA